ncbi:MAG: AGE family epimerase/isomerase [Prolixibacteraceae bacterium]|jgi:mannobiose 2-epimerase|nr:AGE family epimerase/isomerase [Prolixibacteraceae bacterium]
MKSVSFLILLLISNLLFGLHRENNYMNVAAHDIETTLHKHLNDWYPRIIDNENGGYYTNFENNWEKSDEQTKMLVTQARGLWTAAKAADIFPDNELYQSAAHHGYQFITTKMWDEKDGGFNLYYIKEGQKQLHKLLYANAFALFALAEYAKTEPSDELFLWLQKLFNWIDSAAHDDIYGGYYNLILSEEINENTPENKAYIEKLGWGNPKWKDQNTSIHLLEAFTTLHQVMPTPKVKERLSEMLVLVRDSMTQDNGSLKLYFTEDWQPIDHSDSTKKYILENQNIDHVSFGHNIETAYLIIDASKELYGEADNKTLTIAKKLTDHSLKYGFDKNYYGLYDRGYVFDEEMEIINTHKTWWSQFEAWHTLALMHQYFPNNEKYKTAFGKMWTYINEELTDHEYGGFYNNGIDTSANEKKKRKAHIWKGPYHDGRALMKVRDYAIDYND